MEPGQTKHPLTNVEVRGKGVAACCCAHLLVHAGFRVARHTEDQSFVPALMVSASTQALMKDVFKSTDLFAGLPVVDKRIVAWGPQSQAQVLPHAAAVVSEAELAQRLGSPGVAELADAEHEPSWTIIASRPALNTVAQHHFGSRTASVAQVALSESADRSACWIESLKCGWLFLIPGGEGVGYLLAVGGTAEALLSQSRVVARNVRSLVTNIGSFPAYPRIIDPLCGTGWLACGSAALGFDPLCGDGSGNAMREAILAAAVLRAIRDGAEEKNVLAHYRGRLVAAFSRHLDMCLHFYEAGNSGPWWDNELELLRQGIEWSRNEIQSGMPFQFRLRGFELEAIRDFAAG